jgi:glucose-6-phosphate dehydrogenase assembly protein OpcA
MTTWVGARAMCTEGRAATTLNIAPMGYGRSVLLVIPNILSTAWWQGDQDPEDMDTKTLWGI